MHLFTKFTAKHMKKKKIVFLNVLWNALEYLPLSVGKGPLSKGLMGEVM